MAAIASVDWAAARRAVGEVAPRVADLIRSIRHPDRPALGEWNVGDLALHVSQAWKVVCDLATASASPFLGDLWALGGLTAAWVRDEPDHDLQKLAGSIEAAARRFLDESAGASGDGPTPWLVEGTKLPLRSFACHLLNESLVHGYDLARADGQRWRIDPAHARLVLLGFILPVIEALPPRTLVDQQRAAGLHACYDLRLRGGGQAYFLFEDGALSLEGPSSRKVDCHLSADPVELLLVAWGRRSQWTAIARGGLLAWGRKPWLGLRLRSLMKNP